MMKEKESSLGYDERSLVLMFVYIAFLMWGNLFISIFTLIVTLSKKNREQLLPMIMIVSSFLQLKNERFHFL